jgi:Tfp pilus assembly protein PilO
MGGRERLIFSVVAAFVVVAAAWLMFVKPERSQASSLTAQIAGERSTLASDQGQLTVAERARTSYAKEVHAVEVLEKAVPLGDDEPQLIRLIDKLETGHVINWTSVSLSPAGDTAAGFEGLNLSFNFSARYLNLQQFFANLDRLTKTDGLNVETDNRLVTVDSVALAAGTAGATTASVEITVYQLSPGFVPTGATGASGTATTTAAQ